MGKRISALLARIAFFINHWTLELQAYPNPFKRQTNLRIKLARDWEIADLSFRIYNLPGQVVKTFHPPMTTDREITLTWDGRNDLNRMLAIGNYLLVWTTLEHRHTIKPLLIKSDIDLTGLGDL